MAKSLTVLWRQAGENLAASATNFTCLTQGPPEFESAEPTERPVRDAGTFANLRVRISANTISATSTYRLDDSQVATSLSASITASTTGDFTDTSNTASLIATDEVRFTGVGGASGTSLTVTLSAVEFDATSGAVSFWGCNEASSSNHSTDSTTWFFQPVGGRDNTTGTTAEADAAVRVQSACVWSDLYLIVGTVTRSTNTTCKSRVNTGDGNMSVSADGTSNVAYEDASNTDTLSAGADIATATVTSTGGGNFNIEKITTSLVDTSANAFFMGVQGNNERINDSLTRYFPVAGSVTAGEEATEANVSVAAPFAFTLSDLTTHVNRNISADPAFSSRNGGAGNQSTSYASGSSETGVKTDASNTDSISASAAIASSVTSTTGTNYDVQYVALVGATAVAGGDPEGMLIGGKLVGGGLLMRGILR